MLLLIPEGLISLASNSSASTRPKREDFHMEGPRHVALVEFYHKHRKPPRRHKVHIQETHNDLRDEHLLAKTLQYLRAEARKEKCNPTPAVRYVLEHAPQLLQAEDGAGLAPPALQSARMYIKLWQGGMPRTKPRKGAEEGDASAQQLKGFQFLDHRRRHYRGTPQQPGCRGQCEVCKEMTAAFPGWHETVGQKRKGEEAGVGRGPERASKRGEASQSVVTGASAAPASAAAEPMDVDDEPGDGPWLPVGGLEGPCLIASCGMSDAPRQMGGGHRAATSSTPASSTGSSSSSDSNRDDGEGPWGPEKQRRINEVLREMCMKADGKNFVAGLFASSTPDGKPKGGATGVGCAAPAVAKELWGGDDQLQIIGAVPGDDGGSTKEHASMALACFKAHLPEFESWGVRRDPAHDVYNTDRPILLYLGDILSAKRGASATAACFLAFVSRFTTLRFRMNTACTGDMSLSGHLLPVAGLAEKLSGARDIGLTRVVVPVGNFEDPDVVKYRGMYKRGESRLEVLAAENVVELVNHCVDNKHGMGRRDMGDMHRRVGRGRVSGGAQGDAWVECCVYRGTGRLRATGTMPRAMEGHVLTKEQARWTQALRAMPLLVIGYLSAAQQQPWFAKLPRGSRRYDLATGQVTEDRPDGRTAITYKADLHVHFTSFEHRMGSAALTLALVEVILGVKARREVTSFTSITMDGGLVPAVAIFESVVSDGADYFVAPEHERIGSDFSMPSGLPAGMRFKGFENLRDLLCFAFDVRVERGGMSSGSGRQ